MAKWSYLPLSPLGWNMPLDAIGGCVLRFRGQRTATSGLVMGEKLGKSKWSCWPQGLRGERHRGGIAGSCMGYRENSRGDGAKSRLFSSRNVEVNFSCLHSPSRSLVSSALLRSVKLLFALDPFASPPARPFYVRRTCNLRVEHFDRLKIEYKHAKCEMVCSIKWHPFLSVYMHPNRQLKKLQANARLRRWCINERYRYVCVATFESARYAVCIWDSQESGRDVEGAG